MGGWHRAGHGLATSLSALGESQPEWLQVTGEIGGGGVESSLSRLAGVSEAQQAGARWRNPEPARAKDPICHGVFR